MLSKTMPFRAKEVDQLLKQVVRAKFKFSPEDRWKNISEEAKDLISKLLTKDTSKRLTIQQVKKHPWCADAIARAEESLPKMEEETVKVEKEKTMTSMFKPMLQRIASAGAKLLERSLSILERLGVTTKPDWLVFLTSNHRR